MGITANGQSSYLLVIYISPSEPQGMDQEGDL